jgi:hypothetical protein
MFTEVCPRLKVSSRSDPGMSAGFCALCCRPMVAERMVMLCVPYWLPMRTRRRDPETEARAMLRTVKSPEAPWMPSSADSQMPKRSESSSARAAPGSASAATASASVVRETQQRIDAMVEVMAILLGFGMCLVKTARDFSHAAGSQVKGVGKSQISPSA